MIFILIFICCLFNHAALAQSHDHRGADAEVVNPLLIGERVPEAFWTWEHLFYINGDTVRRTLREHRGKLLVLGFWSTSCASCLAQHTQIMDYVRHHASEVVFVKVNSLKTKDDLSKIRAVGEGLTEGKKVSFSTVIEDNYLQHMFPHRAFPHYVWINNLEALQTLTYRNFLDPNYVAPFID